ncbi:MAG TPA: CAP domain-containing protein [Syntrophomonas sp.]|nr:CAP domain-containing protein [Syntrophomonas sp.]
MKKLLSFIVILSFLFIPLYSTSASQPATVNKVAGAFTTTSVKQVQVNVKSLSFRTGATSSHRVITTYSKGTVLNVIGKIGNWYVVKNSKDTVGCVDGRYVKVYNGSTTSSGSSSFNSMQTEMLGYINADRKANGLSALTLDKSLCNGASLKSKDMAENNYFSHTSPTYGSPFSMMQSLGISYTAAGENIALNTSVKGAYSAFMNSSGHRANILSSNFGKVGLGFYQKGSYLYVTQWFTN